MRKRVEDVINEMRQSVSECEDETSIAKKTIKEAEEKRNRILGTKLCECLSGNWFKLNEHQYFRTDVPRDEHDQIVYRDGDSLDVTDIHAHYSKFSGQYLELDSLPNFIYRDSWKNSIADVSKISERVGNALGLLYTAMDDEGEAVHSLYVSEDGKTRIALKKLKSSTHDPKKLEYDVETVVLRTELGDDNEPIELRGNIEWLAEGVDGVPFTDFEEITRERFHDEMELLGKQFKKVLFKNDTAE